MRLSIVFKEVASLWGLSQLMGVARKITLAQAVTLTSSCPSIQSTQKGRDTSND